MSFIKNKFIFFFLFIFHIAGIIFASDNPTKKGTASARIIQIVNCPSQTTADCRMLSKIYPQDFEVDKKNILKPDIYDFSQKKMVNSLADVINTESKNNVDIIHASGNQTIALLNYLNSIPHLPKPTIFILENPSIISKKYTWQAVFYPYFLPPIQQPILNDFSTIPANTCVIIGSNSNTKNSSSKQRREGHRQAQVLYEVIKKTAKKDEEVYHIITNEEYPTIDHNPNGDPNKICYCDPCLFNAKNSTAQTNIANILKEKVGTFTAKLTIDPPTQNIYSDFDRLTYQAHNVKKHNRIVIFFNYALKGTILTFLIYMMYKTGIHCA
ncbi:MAG TPA: hypothetical protein VLB80_01640 [Candidatus Babeliales bacterium]|nr:hypothetical protein [Candidatus Babeliales bacterium]